MLFVVAAGNENRDIERFPAYPPSYEFPNKLAVAATTNQDTRASFSSYSANLVHLGAPGKSVLSTIRRGGYAYMDGTSMSTPHVSGAAALVLSVCALDTPGLLRALLDTVDPIQAMEGITITGGRLNVSTALAACAGGAK